MVCQLSPDLLWRHVAHCPQDYIGFGLVRYGFGVITFRLRQLCQSEVTAAVDVSDPAGAERRWHVVTTEVGARGDGHALRHYRTREGRCGGYEEEECMAGTCMLAPNSILQQGTSAFLGGTKP